MITISKDITRTKESITPAVIREIYKQLANSNKIDYCSIDTNYSNLLKNLGQISTVLHWDLNFEPFVGRFELKEIIDSENLPASYFML